MAGRTHNEVGKGGFTTTRSEDLMRIPYVNLDDHRKLTDAPWFATWIRDNLPGRRCITIPAIRRTCCCR